MYELKHSPITGEIACVIRLSDGANIPLCKDNKDYAEFLKWNSEQEIPLDLNSTIEVVKPEPARDLAKEIDTMKIDITKLKAGKVDKV